jgi:hypothetical protein
MGDFHARTSPLGRAEDHRAAEQLRLDDLTGRAGALGDRRHSPTARVDRASERRLCRRKMLENLDHAVYILSLRILLG